MKTRIQNDIAKIHIAKNDLGMDDEIYRAMLWMCARVKSSKDLDHAGRAKVLEHLKSRGWKPKPPTKAKQKKPLSTEPQHKMIRALWLNLYNDGVVIDPSEKAIARFIKNQTKVDRIEWLTGAQASTLIERLKSWLQRTQNKASNG